MTENVDRFTGRAAVYASHRTRYPEAVSEWLREQCGLTPEWVIADVGAGTGMLAECFLGNGNPVIAIEPNADMRAECERLAKRFPALRIVDATAERTGLDADSVDMVSAGRAFHWFEPAAAAAEFERILRPGGWVAIVSSGRRKEETEQSREFEKLLMEHGTDHAHVRDRYGRSDRIASFFGPLSGSEEHRRIDLADEQSVGLEGFLGATQSMSVAPLEGTAGYADMQMALKDSFARWSEEGVLRLGAVCSVDAGRVD